MIKWILLIAVLVFIGIILIRALMLKPTPARAYKVELEKNKRAEKYGKQLARMIQDETISSRFDSDITKFLKFHETLEELFPNVHRVCEKHNFDGNLLFKWQGKGKSEPILFMSHQDVVEATGTWKHEPFSGDIDEDGNVWGRGTVDTKGSLFCIFTALEELIAEGYEPDCDVYIGSSCTEEWSGTTHRAFRITSTIFCLGRLFSNPLTFFTINGIAFSFTTFRTGFGCCTCCIIPIVSKCVDCFLTFDIITTCAILICCVTGIKAICRLTSYVNKVMIKCRLFNVCCIFTS